MQRRTCSSPLPSDTVPQRNRSFEAILDARWVGHRFDAAAFAAGINACNPRILGIGADSGHHEQRSPSTRVATQARGWRSCTLSKTSVIASCTRLSGSFS
jgi:hypothetical protein